MNIHLRDGNSKDKKWLYGLYCSTLKTHIEKTWGWDEGFQRNLFASNLNPEKFQIVSNDGRNLGAYLVVYEEDHLWLEMVLVNPVVQNQGIGTLIVRKLQNESTNKNKPLKLSVIKINPVKSFYLGLGFQVYKEDESSYKMEWSYNNEN